LNDIKFVLNLTWKEELEGEQEEGLRVMMEVVVVMEVEDEEAVVVEGEEEEVVKEVAIRVEELTESTQEFKAWDSKIEVVEEVEEEEVVTEEEVVAEEEGKEEMSLSLIV